MGYLVYILRCGDGTLYTGCTNDLPRRLQAHQSGRGAKREAAIKRLDRRRKLALIAAFRPGTAEK